MSRTTSPTSTENEEQVVWPEYTPSTAHRRFIERLKRARIECGLSLCDMADLVGLYSKLAHEFENLITPLPFCHLKVWCEVVGVPFDDYLALYWAEMDAYFDAQEREAEQKTVCITHTKADEQKAPTPAPSRSSRGFGFLNLLRSVATHISNRLLSLFSTPK